MVRCGSPLYPRKRTSVWRKSRQRPSDVRFDKTNANEGSPKWTYITAIRGTPRRARLPFQPGPLHAPQKPAEWVPGRQVTLTALRESLSRLSTFWSLPRDSEASGGSSTASRRERQQEARASRHPRTNGSPRPILSSSRAGHRASSVPLKRPGSKWRRARGRQPGCGTTRAAAAAALAKLRGYGTASSMFRCRSRSASASTQSWNAAILGCSAATSVETT